MFINQMRKCMKPEHLFVIAAAFIVFPSLFTDFYKGIWFLQDLFAASVQENPIFFLLDPRGGGLIMPGGSFWPCMSGGRIGKRRH
ncbi:MAG: hypothetical protein AOA65_0104 [Candidatus Bathyarchaeota archaeon BA1]|nr:MAG: hypothetical protein AOA65_0104 [Candidatus Bathyarchaeota archaeon BA1]